MEAFQNIQLSFKCPKALDELQPCGGGWHCNSCKQMVFDFRGMSEDEILEIFRQSGKPLCGMYDANRIKIAPQRPEWYRLASAAMLLLGLNACDNHVKGEPLLYQGKNVVLRTDTTQKDMIFGGISEIDPSFPGGETAWTKYLSQKLKYTGEYRGKVFTQFVVEKDGSLSNIKIIRGGEKLLNEQIINLLKNAPHWRPGIQNGRIVRVQYTLPFNL
ncbi:MAG: energy transducer TonB [Mucilaginibacter sp.]|uniref:energy transducer TonB n=1 Tax=Mucilaginibacter sp. TaxID=1882438 RepID=UPI00326507E3